MGRRICVALWLSLLVVSTTAQGLRRELDNTVSATGASFWDQFGDNLKVNGEQAQFRLPNQGIIGGTVGKSAKADSSPSRCQ